MLSFEINNCVIIIFNKTNMLQMSKYLLNNFNLGLSAHCAAIYACIQQLLCKKNNVAQVQPMLPRCSPCGARGHNSAGAHVGRPYGAH